MTKKGLSKENSPKKPWFDLFEDVIEYDDDVFGNNF